MKTGSRRIWIIDDVYGADDADGAFYRRDFLQRFAKPDVEFEFFSGLDSFLNDFSLAAVQGYFQAKNVKKPDLVLLDVNFGPRPLGYEILDWLAATHATIPVIMLTSLERNSNLEEALDRGAVDFINKSEERAENFWGAVERYLAPSPSEWLVGHHGQFLQALFLLQRFAFEPQRRRLLLQGVEDTEKFAAIYYVARLLGVEPVILDARDASAISTPTDEIRNARLLAIINADAANADEQSLLTALVTGADAATKVITVTTDYLATRVKRGDLRQDFYNLISEDVAHLPGLRERLPDMRVLLRRALVDACVGRKTPLPGIPEAVVARAIASPMAAELSDLDGVAKVIASSAGNRDALERELDEVLGSPPAGDKAAGASGRADTTREQISDVERFLHRVAAHKSVYTVEHDGAELVVFPNVFSPRYSHSSDFLIEMLPVRAGDRVVDIGCGTGVLGIAALRRGAEHATFVDINPDAVENTQANLDRLGLASRGRIALSDVYANVDGKFDLIVSNPPFWNRRAETMLERSCYDENYVFLRKLIEGAALIAKKDTRLAMVMSNQSDTALVFRLLAKYGWFVRDHRMAAARTGRGGANHVRVAWVCDRDPEV